MEIQEQEQERREEQEREQEHEQEQQQEHEHERDPADVTSEIQPLQRIDVFRVFDWGRAPL